MKNIRTFIAQVGITMSVEYARSNPNMDGASNRDMNHFLCLLERADTGAHMSVPFSMGKGHPDGEPTIESVLDCIASDSASVENARSFDDWASELGYDSDSRKAEKIFKACQETRDELREFLGEEAFKELLWETERE